MTFADNPCYQLLANVLVAVAPSVTLCLIHPKFQGIGRRRTVTGGTPVHRLLPPLQHPAHCAGIATRSTQRFARPFIGDHGHDTTRKQHRKR